MATHKRLWEEVAAQKRREEAVAQTFPMLPHYAQQPFRRHRSCSRLHQTASCCRHAADFRRTPSTRFSAICPAPAISGLERVRSVPAPQRDLDGSSWTFPPQRLTKPRPQRRSNVRIKLGTVGTRCSSASKCASVGAPVRSAPLELAEPSRYCHGRHHKPCSGPAQVPCVAQLRCAAQVPCAARPCAQPCAVCSVIRTGKRPT